MIHAWAIRRALCIFILINCVLKLEHSHKIRWKSKKAVHLPVDGANGYKREWRRKGVFFNIHRDNRGKDARGRNGTRGTNDTRGNGGPNGLATGGRPLFRCDKFIPLFLLRDCQGRSLNRKKYNSTLRRCNSRLEVFPRRENSLPPERWNGEAIGTAGQSEDDGLDGGPSPGGEANKTKRRTISSDRSGCSGVGGAPEYPQENVRNFCILAHIDSGKSTLADRFLELTKTIKKKKMQDQFLDMMSLEREKGITIKLKAVRMNYQNYIFNLIDTPGHFDFYHEVKRSLSVCEGAILLIDGSKGIQSQTLNIFLELQKHNLKIIPVINKIDLNTCRLDKIESDLLNKFRFVKEDILHISAKYAHGIGSLFQRIVSDIPCPAIKSNAFFRAIVFDSFYDQYKGVILIIKVLNGVLTKKTEVFFIQSEKTSIIQEVGYLTPEMKPTDSIQQGDIAYVSCNMRKCDEVQISETIVSRDIVHLNAERRLVVDPDRLGEERSGEDHTRRVNHCGVDSFRGVAPPREARTEREINLEQIAASKVDVSYPVVFCNIYSVNDKQANGLEVALNKLKLNDASFSFKPDVCETLGKGFKCGFNGLLHLNIIQERIRREYGVETIVTAPSVNYLVRVKEKGIDKQLKEKLIDASFDIANVNVEVQGGDSGDGSADGSGDGSDDRSDDGSDDGSDDRSRKTHPDGLFYMTSNVNEIPQKNYLHGIYEPYVRTSIMTPEEYQKYIMAECFQRRGIFIKKENMDSYVIFYFDMPLSEILINFLDEIKSCTKGYGSMSYEKYVTYRESDLHKISIYVNNRSIDSLSFLAHKLNYHEKGKRIVLKLKEMIKPHQFLVVIQAGVGTRIFASERINPLRKNVTAKCYGGDITRRRKLLEKQSAGKKKMFSIGKVKLPPNMFTKLFNLKAQ
ncbi:translation factor GUF1 like, mitochondrial [Plasmodium inui San Antonio 1]|uniref:Translation factor GUF1 homolog, mitochondrial n=1 Tax=Plasmodium inui San Antonio 1 TaxID=1237626 RepID=W7A3U0_9APIC|nr:translation factor GUF1 like, mitochondrial [Plasmodium inui San Antonio 1]EUD67942.1 translation factor GUF1 like, mitochondrial [Plasmodium inui San Antonio 1]